MDLKAISAKLAELEKLSKQSQTSTAAPTNKVPGQQPSMTPTSNSPSTVTTPNNTDQETKQLAVDLQKQLDTLKNQQVSASPQTMQARSGTSMIPPQEKDEPINKDTQGPKTDLQQNKKPGEPVVEKKVTRQEYIDDRKKAVALEPSLYFNLRPDTQEEIYNSLPASAQKVVRLQNKYRKAVASTDTKEGDLQKISKALDSARTEHKKTLDAPAASDANTQPNASAASNANTQPNASAASNANTQPNASAASNANTQPNPPAANTSSRQLPKDGVVGTALQKYGVSKADRRNPEFVTRVLGPGYEAGSAKANLALLSKAKKGEINTSTSSSSSSVSSGTGSDTGEPDETDAQRQARLERERLDQIEQDKKYGIQRSDDATRRAEAETAAAREREIDAEVAAFLAAHPGVTYDKNNSTFKDANGNPLGSYNTAINPDTNKIYGIDISGRKDFVTTHPNVYRGKEQPATRSDSTASNGNGGSQVATQTSNNSSNSQSSAPATQSDSTASNGNGSSQVASQTANDSSNPQQEPAKNDYSKLSFDDLRHLSQTDPDAREEVGKRMASGKLQEELALRLDLLVNEILENSATATIDNRANKQAPKTTIGSDIIDKVSKAIPEPVKSASKKVVNNPVSRTALKFGGPAAGVYSAFNSINDFEDADIAAAKGDKVGKWIKNAKGVTNLGLGVSGAATLIPATWPVSIPADIALAIASGSLEAADWVNDQMNKPRSKKDIERQMSNVDALGNFTGDYGMMPETHDKIREDLNQILMLSKYKLGQ
jgi:hypothetical protein